MNMREKIARALAPAAWAALGVGDTFAYKNRRTASLRHADAALGALMEPTEEMIKAGHEPFATSAGLINGEIYFDAEGPYHTFRAMIAAAKDPR